MTENQTTQSLNGDLHEQETIPRGSSDDEECVSSKPVNRCHDLESRSPSPGNRRGSITEAGLPAGKKVPPRPWPPTSSSQQATIPSKPVVRRGSLKGKIWPPPGYNESQESEISPSGGKNKKGPPRQWPPPRRPSCNSTPTTFPNLASILDHDSQNNDSVVQTGDNSSRDQSYTMDSQNNDSVAQTAEYQDDREYDQTRNDISGDPNALDRYQDLQEQEEIDTNKDSHLLAPDSPVACRGTPLNMSPSPPATPEPRSDPSPSPKGSSRECSPERDYSQRSVSPTLQNKD